MTETVHAYARQLRLGTVMLKPDEKAPFRPNKARLRRFLVLLSRYFGNRTDGPDCMFPHSFEPDDDLLSVAGTGLRMG